MPAASTAAPQAIAAPAAGRGGSVGRGGGVFAGVRFVVWPGVRPLVRDVLPKVKRAGGEEEYSVGRATTHVITRPDTPAEEAAALLRASDLAYDSAAAAAATGAGAGGAAAAVGSRGPAEGAPPLLPPGVWFVTPAFVRDSLAQSQLQDPSRYLVALAAASAGPGQCPHAAAAPSCGAPVAHPAGAHAGAAAGAAASAATAAAGADAAASRPAAVVAPAAGGAPPTSAGELGGGGAHAANARDGGGGAGGGIPWSLVRRRAPSPSEICRAPEAWGVDDKWIEPWDEEAAQRTCMRVLTYWTKQSYDACRGGRPGADAMGSDDEEGGGGEGVYGSDDGADAAATAAAAAAGGGARSPAKSPRGGLGSPARGRGGGGGGRGVRRRRSASGAAAAAADSPGSDGAASGDDDGRRYGDGGAGGAPAGGQGRRINTVCGHVCCSARPYCIIAELKRTRDLYLGRADQFRIKAVDRAMGVLARLTWPLTSPDQVRQLGLGKGTADKVSEILATGRFGRNDTYALDAQRATLLQFMEVWGCGEATARKWWAAGCRTLDDVRRRADLTEQQKLGLAHFEDFQRRLPREEVVAVGRVVREAVLAALRSLTGLPEADLLLGLHVRLLGSYVRGAESSSDVDIIVSPGPIADARVSPAPLLTAIVTILKHAGHVEGGTQLVDVNRYRSRNAALQPLRAVPILQDAAPNAADGAGGDARGSGAGVLRRGSPNSYGSDGGGGGGAGVTSLHGGRDEQTDATWLGVWRDATGHYCRVDIKAYRRPLLPFAINYFASGSDFNRALRYYCQGPHMASLAAAYHPGACAFHLSDKELGVLARRGGAAGMIVASVPCRCETDIFRALGLDYVPPHMRDITKIE